MSTPKHALPKLSYEAEIQEFIAAGHKPSVLIVDNSSGVRTAMSEMLMLANLEVIEAVSGSMALETIFAKAPDLVLLDVMLSDINGLSVLKTIRNSYSKLELPVILMTPMDTSGDIVQALDVGANDYVAKPVDFDVMWARISNQLMQKQAAEYMRSSQNRLEQQVRLRTAELSANNIRLKREIKERMLAEDKLQKQASYDALTNLPNRNLANDRLQQVLIKAQRHNLRPCVAFVDLDNFKYVNDTLGHAAGDELLREAACRLQSCARKSDTVARLGGDEFAVIIEGIGDADDAISIADNITTMLEHNVKLDEQETFTSASVGIAVYPGDGKDPRTLLKNADTAMFRAKENGRHCFQFYKPEMSVNAMERLELENSLRKALDNNELTVHYQPIVDLPNNDVDGVEALVRWQHPQKGIINPSDFIPIAEDCGLILQLGEWVIATACKQLRLWEDAGLKDQNISINISPRQFRDQDIVALFKSHLAENNVEASSFTVEITESTLIDDIGEVERTLIQLHEMGMRLALDDFGTGFASLAYLKDFPVDMVKIDRTFVEGVPDSEEDKAIVTAIAGLARGLKLRLLAEGVENERQLEMLKGLGCQLGQGFYWSKALPADQYEQFYLNRVYNIG